MKTFFSYFNKRGEAASLTVLFSLAAIALGSFIGLQELNKGTIHPFNSQAQVANCPYNTTSYAYVLDGTTRKVVEGETPGLEVEYKFKDKDGKSYEGREKFKDGINHKENNIEAKFQGQEVELVLKVDRNQWDLQEQQTFCNATNNACIYKTNDNGHPIPGYQTVHTYFNCNAKVEYGWVLKRKAGASPVTLKNPPSSPTLPSSPTTAPTSGGSQPQPTSAPQPTAAPSCSDTKKDITGACNPACCGSINECTGSDVCGGGPSGGEQNNGYCNSKKSCVPHPVGASPLPTTTASCGSLNKDQCFFNTGNRCRWTRCDKCVESGVSDDSVCPAPTATPRPTNAPQATAAPTTGPVNCASLNKDQCFFNSNSTCRWASCDKCVGSNVSDAVACPTTGGGTRQEVKVAIRDYSSSVETRTLVPFLRKHNDINDFPGVRVDEKSLTLNKPTITDLSLGTVFEVGKTYTVTVHELDNAGNVKRSLPFAQCPNSSNIVDLGICIIKPGQTATYILSDVPAAPKLLSPVNDSNGAQVHNVTWETAAQVWTPTLQWEPIPLVSQYKINFSYHCSGFSEVKKKESIINSSLGTAIQDVIDSCQYADGSNKWPEKVGWTVQAMYEGNTAWGRYSEERIFWVKPQSAPPTATVDSSLAERSDINNDSLINVIDYILLLKSEDNAKKDINRDGYVNALDFSQLIILIRNQTRL